MQNGWGAACGPGAKGCRPQTQGINNVSRILHNAQNPVCVCVCVSVVVALQLHQELQSYCFQLPWIFFKEQ